MLPFFCARSRSSGCKTLGDHLTARHRMQAARSNDSRGARELPADGGTSRSSRFRFFARLPQSRINLPGGAGGPSDSLGTVVTGIPHSRRFAQSTMSNTKGAVRAVCQEGNGVPGKEPDAMDVGASTQTLAAEAGRVNHGESLRCAPFSHRGWPVWTNRNKATICVNRLPSLQGAEGSQHRADDEDDS